MTYPKFKNKHLEEALFSPQDYWMFAKFKGSLPKKFIFVYSNRALNYFVKKYHPKKLEISGMTTAYSYDDIGFIKMSGIGSPHAATVIDEMIAKGGRTFINIGIAGGLQEEGFFLCNRAIRDEGTSYHYLAHGTYTYPNKELTKKLGESMEARRIEFQEGTTWTIDAPYRETKAEIARYKRQGVATVEMEASALFAVAKYRKAIIASAFVVSDILGEKWKPKFHHVDVTKGLKSLVDSAVDCLKKK